VRSAAETLAADKVGVMARGIAGADPVRMLVQGTPNVGYSDGEE
jgi:hypothetical protein